MSAPASAANADIYSATGGADLLFGLPTAILTLIAGMALTEIKPDAEVQFQATAEGQDATVAALAVAKKKKYNATGSGYVLDYAAFLACKSFTYDGIFYVITKWGKAVNFKEFQKADFQAVAFDGVAAASGGSGSGSGSGS